MKADKEPVNPKESSPTALSRRTSSKSPSASGSGFIYGEPVSGKWAVVQLKQLLHTYTVIAILHVHVHELL